MSSISSTLLLVSRSRSTIQRVNRFCEEQKISCEVADSLPSSPQEASYRLVDLDTIPLATLPPAANGRNIALVPLEQALLWKEAVEKRGWETLFKPFSEEELVKLLAPTSDKRPSPPLCIAKSPAMRELLKKVTQVAATQASVFISGESGTGKEVLAELIHANSPRSSHPFIKVNCAAIPETLIESEFFGHERGSFTGAYSARKGRLELAHKGTLLLDEVSETPLSLQAKLLRAIQEQRFERVGGDETLQVDVRFIAASNREMRKAIDERLFREDLYFRLNVVPLQIPPLRERPEDIQELAHHFLTKYSTAYGRDLHALSAGAARRLLTYNWPGNVRELAHAIERSVILASGEILTENDLQLEPSSTAPQGGYLPGKTLDQIEQEWILAALAHYQMNRVRTAEALGISVRTLRNKLRLYRKEVQPELF